MVSVLPEANTIGAVNAPLAPLVLKVVGAFIFTAAGTTAIEEGMVTLFAVAALKLAL